MTAGTIHVKNQKNVWYFMMNEGLHVDLGERTGNEMVSGVFQNIDKVHEWSILLKVKTPMRGPPLHSTYTEDSVESVCEKQLGVKPLWVSIFNEYESVLEFSVKEVITTTAPALSKLNSWGPYQVKTRCIVLERTV